MNGDELKGFPDRLTHLDLMKLALNYSDALMLMPGEEDPEVIAYAQQRGLPVFGPFYVAANGASAAVVDFFDSVWGEGKEEE